MEEKNKITKEEMNLVEYPFQYLGRVVPKEVKTIEWSDITITKDYLDHSFQEELARNETYVQHLIEEIYSVVGKDSPEFIEKVARSVPPDLIFRVLGEIKEMANTGELKTSRYEEFKKLVKRYMKEIYNIKI